MLIAHVLHFIIACMCGACHREIIAIYAQHWCLQKKEVAKKSYEDKGRLHAIDEGPLDDPIAEKLRQQRLVCCLDDGALCDCVGNIIS